MSDEAHLPTEQPGPRAASRLPSSQRDGRRPQGPGGTPRTRPQEAQRLITISRRADFLAANAGRRAAMPGFVLLMHPRADGDPAIRVGYTVTKKIGGAVVRNRMKRRFRALARAILPEHGVAGADHIIIGRSGGIERDYATLGEELRRALAKVKK